MMADTMSFEWKEQTFNHIWTELDYDYTTTTEQYSITRDINDCYVSYLHANSPVGLLSPCLYFHAAQ